MYFNENIISVKIFIKMKKLKQNKKINTYFIMINFTDFEYLMEKTY